MRKKFYRCFAAFAAATTLAASASPLMQVFAEDEYEYDTYHISVNTDCGKLDYLVGEELDLTSVTVYGGFGNDDGSVMGDIFDEELTDLVENGTVTIDTSEFDNTTAGTYTIYVHFGYAVDSFEVFVYDEDPFDYSNAEDYYSIILNNPPTKTVYQIGEELDLTGAVFSASFSKADGSVDADIFWADVVTCVESGTITLNDSEFDSTKPGIYTIYLTYGSDTDSFEVTVTDEGITIVYGDVDCNGGIDILDVIALNKSLLTGAEMTASALQNADMDGDGVPTAADALMILKQTIGIL